MRFIVLISVLFSACSFTSKHVSYFDVCNNTPTGGLTIPFWGSIASHSFRPECAPDILYTWQRRKEIEWNNFEKSPLTKGTYLYTWRTPIATYAFGDIQIRLKLKPGVKFKWVVKNRGGPRFLCPQPDQDSTIYVLTTTYAKTVSEYLICSNKVLHSWSVGTKVAYFEAKNEFEYIRSVPDKIEQHFDAFGFGYGRKRIAPLDTKFSSDSYFVNWDGDKILWNDQRLEKNLESLKQDAFSNEERLFFSPDQVPRPMEHYRTTVKSYFQLTPVQWGQIQK